MRALDRNKQLIYYALYDGFAAVTDGWGNETGESEVSYEDPVAMWINVSPSLGEDEIAAFGVDAEYHKAMVTTDMSCPIDLDTILWVGLEIEDPDEMPAYNYRVASVQKGLNSIRYIIREVTRELPPDGNS